MKKDIIIIDCFVRNEDVEKHLINCIKNFSTLGIDIMLISNTPVSEEIINSVNHFIYDNNNRLFNEEYTNVKSVDLWRVKSDGLIIHDIVSGVQRHGLSVLVNMFNSIKHAKNLGYTHFSRIEVDDIFGEVSMNFIKNVFETTEKAFVYFNKEKRNISLDFIYSEIDFFLESVTDIKSENDFRKYLYDNFKNYDFMIAEAYLYHNLIHTNVEEIGHDGAQMLEDFSDTIWNTVTSDSNLLQKYDQCISKIYDKRINDVFVCKVLFSLSYKESKIERMVECVREDGEVIAEFSHDIQGIHSYRYDDIPDETKTIRVYENDILLYEEAEFSGFINGEYIINSYIEIGEVGDIQ